MIVVTANKGQTYVQKLSFDIGKPALFPVVQPEKEPVICVHVLSSTVLNTVFYEPSLLVLTFLAIKRK